MAARLRATDARARPRRNRATSNALPRWRTTRRRVRGGWRRLGHRSEQPHSRDRCGARRRRLDRHRDGRGRPPSLGRDRLRRVSRPGAAARSVGGGATRGRGGRGGCLPARARARRAHRLRRPRGVRSRRTRRERARERRSARGRGAPAAGARDSRGGPSDVGRGPRTRPARAHRRGVRQTRTTPSACTARSSSGRQMQRPHQARESLFVALAGNPATAAERGLAEIAEPRPDTALT